jgi:hypothetical protein
MKRGDVRDRYVLQVLLATAGCGLLLGVVAVVETPRDWSQPVSDAMAKSEVTASRSADFRDECLPFGLSTEEAQPPAKQHCEETDPSLRGLRSE